MTSIINLFSSRNNKIINSISWGIVVIIVLSNIVARLNISISTISYDVFFTALALFSWIHGTWRYGFKNMLVWFGLTWIVSFGFEALSIKTGFPFGHYHYTEQGFAILGVPTGIMWSYFAIAYTSWIVTQALIGEFSNKIAGIQKFILPFTTSLVMCMFDLITDPKDSTISQSWIWENGGDYFGVPILNFFGWVLTVYVFMQLFTLFISNKTKGISENVIAKKGYWYQAGIVFLSCGLGIVLEGFTQVDNIEIYRTMALVSVFTVVFVSFIAILNTKKQKMIN